MRLAWIAVLAALATPQARADWELLPKNSHPLYQTFGLFDDGQSVLAVYGGVRVWAGLGASFAVVGDPATAAHPQIVVTASVRGNGVGGDGRSFAADEVHARLGVAFEWALNPMMRVSVGYRREGAVVVDSAVDASLIGTSGVDVDRLLGRFVFDLGPYARVGATLEPVLHGNPAMSVFGLNEFIEVFPLGGGDDVSTFTPFVALGFEQGGTQQYGIVGSYHVQVGCALGSHFVNEYKPPLRLVAGWHAGADPRLKYFALRDQRATFFYAGVMLDF